MATQEPSTRRARLIELAAIVALFTIGSIIFTWPLVPNLEGGYVHAEPHLTELSRADLYLTSWILSWDVHQLLRAPWRLFDANFFYPLPRPLAFSEHLLGGALLVLPTQLLRPDPVLAHNVLVLASFVLGATGVALLVRDLGGTLPSAIAAGALFAFGPLRVAQLGHVQALSTQWMPFAMLFLHRVLRGGGTGASVGFVATLLLSTLSSVYYLYYFGIAVSVFVAAHAVFVSATDRGAHWRVVGLGIVTLLLLAPSMLPYARVPTTFALTHDPAQPAWFSCTGEQYLDGFVHPLASLNRVMWEGQLRSPIAGAGLLLLALVGTARRAAVLRGGRAMAAGWATVAIVMVLLSLGPGVRMHLLPVEGIAGPHRLLAAVVPGFSALRVPQRAAAVGLLAIAVLAGLGADALVGRGRRARMRVAGGLLLAVIVGLECVRPPLQVLPERLDGADQAVHRWLGRQPGDFPVVELPMDTSGREAHYMLASTLHWKRLVNGYSGSFPARSYLRGVFARFPDDASRRLLRGLRVRYVLVHFGVRPGLRWLCFPPHGSNLPALAVRYVDASACALEVLPADDDVPPRPAARAISLEGATLTASSGEAPGTAADGDLRTHWVQSIDGDDGWLRVDLPAPRPVARIVLRLGGHFGEYLRSYRVERSVDGIAWEGAQSVLVATPPLVDLLDHPDDLRSEIVLDGTAVSHLRIVRPAASVQGLYLDWGWWGVHEIELYENESASP